MDQNASVKTDANIEKLENISGGAYYVEYGTHFNPGHAEH